MKFKFFEWANGMMAKSIETYKCAAASPIGADARNSAAAIASFTANFSITSPAWSRPRPLPGMPIGIPKQHQSG
jgi:hypothetical protein